MAIIKKITPSVSKDMESSELQNTVGTMLNDRATSESCMETAKNVKN
jgi:hypothetical protein